MTLQEARTLIDSGYTVGLITGVEHDSDVLTAILVRVWGSSYQLQVAWPMRKENPAIINLPTWTSLTSFLEDHADNNRWH